MTLVSPEVRYRVIFIARTLGSRLASRNRRSTEVVTGTLTTQVRFKGAVVLRDLIPDFEFKPGRWSVDTFMRLPDSAETGVYALEIHFEEGSVQVDESLTFGVDG